MIIVANTCAERVNVPGYGTGEFRRRGWFGLERRRWQELFDLDEDELEFFELHTEADIERALDLFNGSDHQRTIAGLARTLGTPYVGVTPDADQPSQVSLVVAWELSWYRYRVDLGDEDDPVMMLEKGDEIDQIDAGLRDWNATLDSSGRALSGGQAVTDGGSEA
jgi:hypothetical protein